MLRLIRPIEERSSAIDGGQKNTDPSTQADPSLSDLSPADFGFGQPDKAVTSDAGQVNGEGLTSAELKTLDQPSEIFSPIKFENPFERNRSHTRG